MLILLINKDEEALECLCTLLAIVGKTLDKCDNSTKVQGNLNEIFRIMNELANSEKTSNRVRVLLMNVIDLRSNNWISFREDSKSEVHEEMMQHLLLSTAARKNKIKQNRNRYKRVISDGGWNKRVISDGGWNKRVISDGGWNIASNLRSGPFDSSRLRSNTFINPADNNFESKGGFSHSARGSSGEDKDQEDEFHPCNRFVVLDQFQPQQEENRRNIEMPLRLALGGSNLSHRQSSSSFGRKSMSPNSEKDLGASAKNITVSDNESNTSSGSNSQQNSRENSPDRDNQLSPIHLEAAQLFASFSENIVLNLTKLIVEDYFANDDIEKAVLYIQEIFKGKNIAKFVQFSLEWVLNREAEQRRAMGKLYHQLLNKKLITQLQFIEGVVGENLNELGD